MSKCRIAYVLLAFGMAACTDWDASGGTGPAKPALSAQGAASPSDAGTATDTQALELPAPSLPKAWETWTPPPIDVPPPPEDVGPDAADADAFAPEVLSDTSPPGDVGPLADAGAVDGLTQELATVEVSKPDATGGDVAKSDAVEADVIAIDAQLPDVTKPFDAAPDAVVVAVDASPDGGIFDGFVPDPVGDVSLPDVVVFDSQPEAGFGETFAETSKPDVFVAEPGPEAGPTDSGLTEGLSGDGGIQDGGFTDSGFTDIGFSDGAPDWQGYDLKFPADADIYGGAISSCLAVYLYQQETCGKDAPSAACINQVATEGSLYANTLFEPLRACQVQACVPLCAGSTANDCMEGCMGKYCATQFLGCVSNAANGTQSCAQAFACADLYEGKLQTIASKCYAAASPTGQVQLSAVIGCVAKPQTDSCVSQMAACFGSGTGTQSCSKTFQCLEKCKENEPCSWDCLGKGSAKAVQLLDSLWDCAVQVCGPQCAANPEPACQDQCLVDKCNKQVGACLSD